jgi:NAD(P)-dependent dehydrogenase (short-subunit alcohol dehydrogenase family)
MRHFSTRIDLAASSVAILLLLSFAGCVTPFIRDTAREFAGKTVVITPSSGFGRGAAVAFAARGANVAVAARRTQLLEEVAREVRSAGGTPLVVTTDVGEPQQVARLARETVMRFGRTDVWVVMRFGRIDVWVNNAGVTVISRFEDAPVQDYSRLVDINLKGVIYGSYAALRQFRVQGSGTLINVGSVNSEVPLAYQAVYSATKAGVLSLGRTLNEEIRLSGRAPTIRVVTIMPWAADTPIWSHAANYTGHAARMVAMDDPQKIVNAIVRASIHPHEELPVGWKAQGSYTLHRLLPDFTETLAANIAHREMEKGAPVPPSSGNLHKPMNEGREVRGGVRERMKLEDRQRR